MIGPPKSITVIDWTTKVAITLGWISYFWYMVVLPLELSGLDQGPDWCFSFTMELSVLQHYEIDPSFEKFNTAKKDLFKSRL